MAEAHIVEFAVFRGAGDDVVAKRAAAAAKVAGLVEQYAGTKTEEPSESVHVTVWRTAAARGAFAAAAAQEATPLLTEVLAVGSGADEGAQLAAALGAPTTEVFTGYGAQPTTYAAATRKFRELLDAQIDGKAAGYFGSAVVETVEDVAPGAAAVEAVPARSRWTGPAVKLLIGWTSREAHLEAKAKPGPIEENIGLLRSGIQAGDMYHVNFKKV